MGIPKLEETYEKDHYSPGTQEKIKMVVKQGKEELSDNREEKITKDSVDAKTHSDTGQIGILRRVMCNNCDFEGVLEAPDTSHYPETSIFRLIGKDNEGRMQLECPSCKTHISYSSNELLGFKLSNKGIIFTLIALVLIVTTWLITK